jgi:hypothetical protein
VASSSLYISLPFCLSFTHSLIHSFTHSLVHSFARSLIRSFTHSLVHSFTRSLIRSFTSGGFVDVIDFQTLFNYGLDLSGQNFEIELDLPDNASALSSVLKVIGDLKVSLSLSFFSLFSFLSSLFSLSSRLCPQFCFESHW